ncbi:MAG: cell wall hydrolase [Bosea sp. (in: a-proteobacteria)]
MKRTMIAANPPRRMSMSRSSRKAIPLLISLAAPALGACSLAPVETASTAPSAAKSPSEARKRAVALAKADPREKDCLVRAMYFESNRSSESGLLGVGTVVMNRVESQRYPDTICGVVGAPRQFASGVLTRPMAERDLPKVAAVAEDILNGRRSDAVGSAKHFHMAGMRFSYPNMHYVTVAGGNAFYVKGERPGRRIEEPSYQIAEVATPAPLATAASSLPMSFEPIRLAFAAEAPAPAAVLAIATASPVVSQAPLPPSRPLDLNLPRKSIRAFIAPPKTTGPRLAALTPVALRGSVTLD